jgi:septum site-determining protein MinD
MKDVILITSGKGGVGKSTVSSLISMRLANKNKILLIDADPGLTNLNIIFNIKQTSYDIYDVVKGICSLEDALIKIKDNLYMLNLFQSTELEKNSFDLLDTIIYYLKDDFDYFVVDSPAGIDQSFINCLKVSNKIVIVLNDELTSYEDARKVKRLCKVHNKNQIIYVMNRFNRKESFKEYIKTRVNYYLNDHNLFYINQVPGSIYKKYRMLCLQKDFVKLYDSLTRVNSHTLF